MADAPEQPTPEALAVASTILADANFPGLIRALDMDSHGPGVRTITGSTATSMREDVLVLIAKALDRGAAQRAAEAVDRARPILGDTAIRHAGQIHAHAGPCKPDCPPIPPSSDAGERAREIITMAVNVAANVAPDMLLLHWRVDRELVKGIAAALQSERTAAASEARKAARGARDALQELLTCAVLLDGEGCLPARHEAAKRQAQRALASTAAALPVTREDGK